MRRDGNVIRPPFDGDTLRRRKNAKLRKGAFSRDTRSRPQTRHDRNGVSNLRIANLYTMPRFRQREGNARLATSARLPTDWNGMRWGFR